MPLIEYTFDQVVGQTIEKTDDWKEQLAIIMFTKKKKLVWVRSFNTEEKMMKLHLTLQDFIR